MLNRFFTLPTPLSIELTTPLPLLRGGRVLDVLGLVFPPGLESLSCESSSESSDIVGRRLRSDLLLFRPRLVLVVRVDTDSLLVLLRGSSGIGGAFCCP